jgi:ribosomal peptide maturation radical SAM protein 1
MTSAAAAPPQSGFQSVALISAPWPFFSRPSIQLGSLKAYLKRALPDLRIDAHHFYLKLAAEIGYDTYHGISERSWLAESVYATLLYPQRQAAARKLFESEARKVARLRRVNFEALCGKVKKLTDHWITSVEWQKTGLAGFSLCLCQLTASLYCIRRIKALAPQLPVVAGGSMFAGPALAGLMAAFPEIDFMVNGEGERPLTRLVQQLKSAAGPQAVPSLPGLVRRADLADNREPLQDQLPSLAALPPPDYDDYFRLLGELGPDKAFFPTLSAEISRGCYWRSTRRDGVPAGCAFCNLNRQWQGYRFKPPQQVASEIDGLTQRYRLLSVVLMDNLLPARQSPEIFARLQALKKDLSLFGEIRATTPLATLGVMRAAGVQEVQIGIEALSTRLLRKLNKGTTAIQNLEIMKHCEALGIENRANLICGFPGSDDQDVAETLATLDFALPFRPPKTVYFWLGTGSPVWQQPERFGIRGVANHPRYRALFPPETLRRITFITQGYRGDQGRQRARWRPVEKKVRGWAAAYAALHRAPASPPILGYRDGGDFLIIRQRRPGADTQTHRLANTSRAIYLFCEQNRSLAAITRRFCAPGEAEIRAFLNMMVAKRLMFAEGDRYLSLAVPAGRQRGA